MTTSVGGQVRAAIAALREAGDPDYVVGLTRYFRKDAALKFFGVKTPVVRQIERQLWGMARPTWTRRDGLMFADRMMRRPELEAKVLGCARLHRFVAQGDHVVLRACTGWLRDGYCASWAAVDCLCNQVVSPLVAARPDLLVGTQRWGRARLLWLRRASVVVLVPFARKGVYLDACYDAALRHLEDSEDLMHKAVGWLLRETGTTDRSRLEAFLLQNGPAVRRTTVRYAIEKFPERRRQELLRRTAAA